uniref:Acylphosphatase n=1 Tax=Fervidicoccus fontis TaxID=683846 RepID=A0A7J3ZK60_9CREN
MAKKVRTHLRIYGRVQGVFFRAHMRDKALEHGVTGWVRNNPDGSVEAVIEGDLESVMRVVCWALRGPPLARVERVVLEWQKYTGEFSEFRIVY